jgi:hypothetical protein
MGFELNFAWLNPGMFTDDGTNRLGIGRGHKNGETPGAKKLGGV